MDTTELPSVTVLGNPSDDRYATFVCPKCGFSGTIDKDQYEGKVSIQCPLGCSFHETIDFRSK